MRARRLASVLAVAFVLLGGTVSGAPIAAAASVSGLSAALALGPDCKGDPPVPLSPSGLLSVRPAATSDGDPFADTRTSIQSVYGTNFGWWTYDNGCAAGSAILPGLGTNIATLVGLQIAGLAPNWGQALMSAVVNPTWTHQLDSVVTNATASTSAGVWYPWLTVSLLLVAVLSFRHAVRGAIPAVVTGVVWSLLVLVVVTWTVNYPRESVDLLDSGIQTAVVSTATGFSGGAASSATSPGVQAVQEMDHEWDLMVRSTLYLSWLQGAFGSADSATAKTYGPALFKATHFSWSEYDTYQADPNGKGKALVDRKAGSFRQIADQVQASDPVAYQAFTGNNYWDRLGIGLLSLVEMIVVAWFLLVAAVIILVAYLLVRLVVPLAPAAGVFFLVEPLRAMALGWLRRIAGLLVMGPLFFLAALVVGRFNSAVMSSDLNMLLKLVLVGAVAVLAWRLLRPHSMAARLRVPGLAALGGYLGSKAAWPRRASVSDNDAASSGEYAAADQTSAMEGPVYVGSSLASRGSPRVFEHAPEESIVFTATNTAAGHHTTARGGTFAPRSPAVLATAAEGADALGPGSPDQRGLVSTPHRVALQAPPEVRRPIALPGVPDVLPLDGRSVDLAAGPDVPHSIASVQHPLSSSEVGDHPQGARTAESGANVVADRVQVGMPCDEPRADSDSVPADVHVANVTYDSSGRPVFQIYTPERDVEESRGGVVYGA